MAGVRPNADAEDADEARVVAFADEPDRVHRVGCFAAA